MRALFDVNMLLALFDADHVHHRMASDWRKDHQKDGWASCAITENGFVRIMSTPRRPQPISVASALAGLRAQVTAEGHEFWPSQVSIADRAVFNHDRILGPKQITDVYLLALAVRNQGQLVTFDGAIPLGAVRDAELRHLVVL